MKKTKVITLAQIVNIPNVITLLNGVFGILAIFFAIRHELNMAAIFILIATLFDYLDGKVARFVLSKRERNRVGGQLDSLADIISFGAAPIVFGFMISNGIISMVIYVVFLMSCLIRLARFNVMDVKDHFIGTPVTLNGILIPLLYFVLQRWSNVEHIVWAYAILAVTMLIPVKVMKFR